MTAAKTVGAVRFTAWLTRVTLIIGAVAAVVTSHLSAGATPVALVLVALGLALGVPHGALDHFLAAEVLEVRAFTAAAGYAALAAAAWAILHWGGAVPLAFMIVASIVHFGLGEVETMGITLSTNMIHRGAIVITGAGCLILPLARGGAGWDETLRTLSPALAGLLGDGSVRLLLIGVWAASAALTAYLLVCERRWPALFDVAVIGVVGSVVAPLVAFALWFGLWHGPRHIARMVSLEMDSSESPDGRRSLSARAALGILARRAAPVTLSAFGTLATVVGVVVGYGSTTAAIAAAIIVLLALTAPHMAVVAALDAAPRQRRRDHKVAASGRPAVARVNL